MSTDEHTNDPRPRHSIPDPAPAQHYEIRVSGHLGSRWATWFDGMTLVADDDGTSIICGNVVDQAALHGLLQKLRDLGITLISLTPLAPETVAERPQETLHRTQCHAPGATS